MDYSSSGSSGMVSTPHPLATRAGVEILRAGGNAVDAAIAANAVLTVVMPDQCGLGGDLFALIFNPEDNRVYGMNGSGAAPAGASPVEYTRLGFESMPQLGPFSITVPGVVDAWGKLQNRFGSLPFTHLLQPAERLAENGFPISPSLANSISTFKKLIIESDEAEKIFCKDGNPLKTGEILIQKNIADIIKTISSDGYRSYYEGWIAEEITRSMQKLGGFLNEDDLRFHQSEWVEPIHTNYRGRRVFTMPPNSSGLIFLSLVHKLNQLSPEDTDFQSSDFIAACVKYVLQTRDNVQKWIADPRFSGDGWKALLENGFTSLEENRIMANETLAGDTIALCTIDSQGMGVSLIQSIYHDFGSGVFVDKAGFFMQNRGASFSLDPLHPNSLAPKKRPGHTLTPALVVGNDGLDMLFGTRGGAGQPQTLTQILSAVLDYGMDIQSALTEPRWIYGSVTSARTNNHLVMEKRFPSKIVSDLEKSGIPVNTTDDFSPCWMGCAQGIVVDRMNKRYLGGADPRSNGLAAGY